MHLSRNNLDTSPRGIFRQNKTWRPTISSHVSSLPYLMIAPFPMPLESDGPMNTMKTTFVYTLIQSMFVARQGWTRVCELVANFTRSKIKVCCGRKNPKFYKLNFSLLKVAFNFITQTQPRTLKGRFNGTMHMKPRRTTLIINIAPKA
ncbi:hypothetical protein O6H91_01G097500 [Diphasiastrum complanatum]|uniref:Uncharacterized protein n=1 Tax=Diphasiastrum complanatum TaxID=34168 RepID=A0ACC2ETY8_DIPCM|nr:hypothetical protein O6H91_01G097500 [Diphasiastrum complanatum]